MDQRSFANGNGPNGSSGPGNAGTVITGPVSVIITGAALNNHQMITH